MIEFVQQNNAGPSAFHDLFPQGGTRSCLHHVAMFVDDLKAEMLRYEEAGMEIALYAEMNDGFAFAMMDVSASLGHMIELYEPVAQLTGFYAMVAKAARNYDGADPVRTIQFS